MLVPTYQLLSSCVVLPASQGPSSKKSLPHLGRALTDVQEMRQACESVAHAIVPTCHTIAQPKTLEVLL